MKLNRSTATAQILILFFLASIWLSFYYRWFIVIPLTIFFCIPWVVRKTGKLLKECFREDIQEEYKQEIKDQLEARLEKVRQEIK